MNTHQVVDFGEGPVDCSTYPFEGTEQECIEWIESNGFRDIINQNGEPRFCIQEIPYLLEECRDPLDDRDIDQNNPVDMSAEAWLDFYARNPDYDIDHDHSMDY